MTRTGSTRTFGPVATFAAVCVGLLVAYVGLFRGDVSSLVCSGRDAAGKPPLEAVTVAFPTDGYDGQYVYAVARTPWAKHESFLDLPGYRHLRIALPAAAWAVTGGDAKRILWALPALNALALIVLAWLGARLAVQFERSPWWGLPFPFAINAVCPAFRDLTDPVATVSAVGLVACVFRGRRAWACFLWGTLALLAREQNLVVVGLVGVAFAVRKEWRSLASIALAGAVWLAWLGVLRHWYGTSPFNAANVGRPFEGVGYRLARMFGPAHSDSSPVHVAGMATLGLQFALCGCLMASRTAWFAKSLGAAGAILAILGGVAVYAGLESYLRVFWWMPFGVWLGALQTGKRWPLWLLCSSFVWPVYSLAQAWSFNSRGMVTYL